MPNLYEWLAQSPELGPLYAALALFLVAWLYWSSRKLITWATSIQAGLSRGHILPPDDLTNEIALFMLVVGVNLLLIGGYIYVVT